MFLFLLPTFDNDLLRPDAHYPHQQITHTLSLPLMSPPALSLGMGCPPLPCSLLASNEHLVLKDRARGSDNRSTLVLTFSLQQLELLAGSKEVLPEDDEDDAQWDGGDEDVRPHDGHSKDGTHHNQ